MKYQVRNGKKGEFEVKSAEVTDSTTRTWIAKCIVVAVLALLAIALVHAVFTGGPQAAQGFIQWGERTLLLVLGYYFGKN
jgi:hypothetical protein